VITCLIKRNKLLTVSQVSFDVTSSCRRQQEPANGISRHGRRRSTTFPGFGSSPYACQGSSASRVFSDGQDNLSLDSSPAALLFADDSGKKEKGISLDTIVCISFLDTFSSRCHTCLRIDQTRHYACNVLYLLHNVVYFIARRECMQLAAWVRLHPYGFHVRSFHVTTLQESCLKLSERGPKGTIYSDS